MLIDIWHNILWSRYKGGVFSALHRQAEAQGVGVRFFQIAETEKNRQSLGTVDLSYHQYPFELVFTGAFDEIPHYKLAASLLRRVWGSQSDMTILAGYDRPEYWLQLVALMLKGKRRGVFCNSTAFDRPQSLIKYILKSFFFRNCDVIFCYGQRSRQYILSHGVSEENIRFRCQAAALPHDYDVKSIVEQRVANISRAPLFLYVGRLSPEKNLVRLIEAFARVHLRFPTATLQLLGDGAQRPALEEVARSSGIVEAVTFAGPRSNEQLAHEYLTATCMVLPSLSEPWGLVVNEALSYGCPVIVSDRCGCVPELVTENVSGFVFDASNTDELAEKMTQAATQWNDARQTAVDCTRIIGMFTPDAAATQILEGCIAVVGRP